MDDRMICIHPNPCHIPAVTNLSLEPIFNFFGLRTPRRAEGTAPELPFGPEGSQSSAPFSGLTIGSRQVPLLMVRHRRARRYLLRLGADGTARVTIPPRGSLAGARAFAERHREWLAAELARLPSCSTASQGWRVGGQIWFRGELVSLMSPQPGQLRFGAETLEVPEIEHDIRPMVERRLRWLAKQELPGRVANLAAQHEFRVGRVTVRNQKTRWGSCSSGGAISLNWRLIQTPDFVRDYVILHELAHLRHMNHSARFWREVRSLCPDYERAKQWLKERRHLLQ